MAVGDRAAGDGDEVGLLRAGERLAIARLPLVAEHRLHPAFRKASADVEDGVAADVERAADLGEAPALPQFERDLGAGASASALMAQVDEGLQAGAVQLGEHDVVARRDERRLR